MNGGGQGRERPRRKWKMLLINFHLGVRSFHGLINANPLYHPHLSSAYRNLSSSLTGGRCRGIFYVAIALSSPLSHSLHFLCPSLSLFPSPLLSFSLSALSLSPPLSLPLCVLSLPPLALLSLSPSPSLTLSVLSFSVLPLPLPLSCCRRR